MSRDLIDLAMMIGGEGPISQAGKRRPTLRTAARDYFDRSANRPARVHGCLPVPPQLADDQMEALASERRQAMPGRGDSSAPSRR